ncbi:DUF7601 domain-containing protein [Faecalibaculum rodentium]|uniref:DUF7601 domain-containing protein n=1 Tax=Faecalibaculum rodentium TaxID=1702221 RepID=UPI0023F4C1D5|nr:hypothetical protein [Faecalibaculum rodentium]
MKNFKTKLFAAAMAAPLAMSGMSVFATEATINVTIQKTYNVPEGAKLTGREGEKSFDQTFDFTVTPITQGAPTGQSDWSAEVTEDAYATTTTYTASTDITSYFTTAFNGHKSAGIYDYKITETAGDTAVTEITGNATEGTVTTTSNLTYATNTYMARVYVANNETGDGTHINNIVLYKGESPDDAQKVESDDNGKVNAAFTNTLTQTQTITPGDDITAKGLSVTNNVTGNLADKKKDFGYSLTFTAPNGENGTIAGVIKKQDGSTQTVSFTSGTASSIDLKHGESFALTSAPAGTTYKIVHTDTDANYTLKSTDVTGTPTPTISDTKKTVTGVVPMDKLAVSFTNEYNNENIPTGNIINNMPFLGLIAVALGGFIAYIALKRRQNA